MSYPPRLHCLLKSSSCQPRLPALQNCKPLESQHDLKHTRYSELSNHKARVFLRLTGRMGTGLEFAISSYLSITPKLANPQTIVQLEAFSQPTERKPTRCPVAGRCNRTSSCALCLAVSFKHLGNQRRALRLRVSTTGCPSAGKWVTATRAGDGLVTS